MTVKSFYFIRHGQSRANADNYPAGQLDSPLTEQGLREAKAVREIAAQLDPQPVCIVTSTLSRAKDTAAIINQALNLTVTEDADLCEQDYGTFQGQPKNGIRAAHGTFWYSEPPGGERYADFRKRIHEAVDRIVAVEGLPLIVGHGGMIMALSYDEGAALETLYRVGNCAVLRVEWDVAEENWRFSDLGRAV